MFESVDEDNNIYHGSIGIKPIDEDCSALTEEIETDPKAAKFSQDPLVQEDL